MTAPYWIQKGSCYLVPALHHCVEVAGAVHAAIQALQPDCIAVELPESIQDPAFTAAARLPDLTLIHHGQDGHSAVYLVEPCDPAFEALRSGVERDLPSFCVDLPIASYPRVWDPLPDPYAITHLGHRWYCEKVFAKWKQKPPIEVSIDGRRELHMAKKLRELSFSYDRILVVVGMKHVQNILAHLDDDFYPRTAHETNAEVWMTTPDEPSCREILPHGGWVPKRYEEARQNNTLPIDRQQLLVDLYLEAAKTYCEDERLPSFPPMALPNLLKFSSNYARITGQFVPDFFQTITAAKGCVDHTYAYHVWKCATDYPYLRNVDSLPEISVSPEEIWGAQKRISFHRTLPSRKWGFGERQRQEKKNFSFQPLSPYGICSYPPEDLAIEAFGNYLEKKGKQILADDNARTVPFSTSLEDGIDSRETIRHWFEKKIFVRQRGRPQGKVGSVVVVFDEDPDDERYRFKTTWLGEHNQESDMAFYSTPIGNDIVGPGISRCTYGGFLMSYPPRRMQDVWNDSDYALCRTKAEVLLVAGIDYSLEKIVVYVAKQPPRSWIKTFASRFGKKIVYLPIGQLSAVNLRKLRYFHILDGHHRREIADQYIF